MSIALSLFAFSLLFSPSEAFAEKSLKKGKETRKPVSEAMAYDRLKDWQINQASALEGNRKAIQKALKAMKNRNGIESAEYSFAVLDIFKSQPLAILEEAERLHGTSDCLMYWLIPETQEISYQEIELVFRKNQNANNSVLRRFEKKTKKYFDSIRAAKPQPLDHCRIWF